LNERRTNITSAGVILRHAAWSQFSTVELPTLHRPGDLSTGDGVPMTRQDAPRDADTSEAISHLQRICTITVLCNASTAAELPLLRLISSYFFKNPRALQMTPHNDQHSQS